MFPQLIDPSSYSFNFHAVPPFIVGLSTAMLGLFLLIREKASLVSIAFHTLCVLIAIWLLSFSMVLLSMNPSNALFWLKMETASAALIPSAVLFFTLSTLRKIRKLKAVLAGAAILAVLFALAGLFSSSFIADVVRYPWGYYSRYGSTGAFFIIYFGLVMIYSLLLFWREHQRTEGVKRQRLKIFLWSFGIGYLAAVDYLPAFGIAVFPFGYVFACIYLVLMSLGIWRYRSIDLDSYFAADEIIRIVNDAIVVIDNTGIIRLSNYAANRLFNDGVSLEAEPMKAIKLSYFNPENLNKLLYEDKTQSLEAEFNDKERGRVFLNISASRIFDKTGAPLAIVCSIRDLTQHKMNEEALKRSENQYRLLAGHMSEVIWTMDNHFRFTFISPSIKDLTGFSEEEALQRSLEETLSGDSVKLFMKCVAEVLSSYKIGSAPAVLDLELKCKNGGSVWVEAKVGFIKNEAKKPEILCVLRDATELRKVHAALLESEIYYQEMVQHCQDPIITMDRHGYIQAMNISSERCFGYSADELKEKHFSKTGLFAANFIGRTMQEFTFCILGWQRKPFELQLVKRGGEIMSLRAVLKVLRRDASNLAVQLVLKENLNILDQPDSGRASA